MSATVPNDSSTGGLLDPTSLPDTDDTTLDDIFPPLIGALLSLDPSMVRPRWQPTPLKAPEHTVDWAAVGVMVVDSIGYPSIGHDAAGNGQDVMIVQEEIELLVSTYGPDAMLNASLLRDSLMVPQNREGLAAQGIAYVRADPIRRVPSLTNTTWINRADIRMQFRRTVTRAYAVRSLLAAQGSIQTPILNQPFVTGSNT